MGVIHCYLQRAHGVLEADGNICLPCKISIRLTFSGLFLRAGLSTKQPSLYFFFTNGMRVICIIGEEDQIVFSSFRAGIVQYGFSDFTHCVELRERKNASVK